MKSLFIRILLPPFKGRLYYKQPNKQKLFLERVYVLRYGYY